MLSAYLVLVTMFSFRYRCVWLRQLATEAAGHRITMPGSFVTVVAGMDVTMMTAYTRAIGSIIGRSGTGARGLTIVKSVHNVGNAEKYKYLNLN